MSELLSSTTKMVVWKIRNIEEDLFTDDRRNDEKISKHFTVINDDHHSEWYFQFQAVESDFEFYLHLKDSSIQDFKIDFSVDLVSSKNDRTIKRSFQKEGKDFADTDSGWELFVNSNQLMENFQEFVVDENLTFFCSLTLHLLPPSESKTLDSSNKCFFSSYKKFFQNETFSDFKIESSNGKIFNCHKLALVAQSEVFEKMLTSEMKETREGICKIEDFNSKIVEAMLKHIYFQKISNLEEIARELIFAAEKYELKELKKVCIGSIVRNLHDENVIEALKICDKISDCDALYKKCVAVFLKNWHKIMDSEECKSFSNEILLKLYKSHVDALMTVEVLVNEEED